MTLGENIYKYRTQKNLSQGELAEALDVSRQSVSKWETGTAVPELDKLVKMCHFFDVTLDALVNGESRQPPEESVPAEKSAPSDAALPEIIYVEKPAFPAISRQHLTGAILLFCALLYGLILYNGRLGVEETLFLVLPVAGWGISCLLSVHPLFYCGWIGAGGYWAYLFILSPRWEYQYFLIILGVALTLAMVVITVRLRRKGILSIPTWAMILGSIILILLFILLCMNCIPFTMSAANTYPVTPAAKQGGELP